IPLGNRSGVQQLLDDKGELGERQPLHPTDSAHGKNNNTDDGDSSDDSPIVPMYPPIGRSEADIEDALMEDPNR
ncbi:MAG: hypothetical protein LBB54_06180, partial [Cellulomonadaceae bacterium]|nr:hypothetical protein [Cellulomonadaceae bacterium]